MLANTTTLDGCCPECGAAVDADGHEVVCRDCGLVVDEDALEHGREWRLFDAQDRARVGAPRTLTRHDRGLGTLIGDGGELPGRQRRRHRWAKTSSKVEYNRMTGLQLVRLVVESLELTDHVHQTACQLWEQAQDERLLLGRSVESMAGAAVLGAARIHSEPATAGAVAEAAGIDESRIRTSYTALRRDLEAPIPPSTPEQHIPRLCSAVDRNGRTATKATELVREHREELVGRKPAAVAAAAIYLATFGTVTQLDLCEAADVTDVTLRASRDIMERSA